MLPCTKITIYFSGKSVLKDLESTIHNYVLSTHPELLKRYITDISIRSGLPHLDYGQTITVEFGQEISEKRLSKAGGELVFLD